MIFKPKFKDVVYGQTMEEATEKRVCTQVASMMSLYSAISSHCSVLTSNEWIDGYKMHLLLAENITKVSNKIKDEKERKKQKKQEIDEK